MYDFLNFLFGMVLALPLFIGILGHWFVSRYHRIGPDQRPRLCRRYLRFLILILGSYWMITVIGSLLTPSHPASKARLIACYLDPSNIICGLIVMAGISYGVFALGVRSARLLAERLSQRGFRAHLTPTAILATLVWLPITFIIPSHVYPVAGAPLEFAVITVGTLLLVSFSVHVLERLQYGTPKQ